MHHKFKVTNKSKIYSPKRREALPIQAILNTIKLEESKIIADIGCGIGYFTFPISEAVGESGIVYALDIENEMLEDIKRKIIKTEIKNVIPLISKEYEFPLNEGSVEVAFICTMIHEVKIREKFLKEVNRILRTNGKIIIIEWIKEYIDYGPPIEHRIDKDVLSGELLRTGFKDINIIDLNEYFYIISATK